MNSIKHRPTEKDYEPGWDACLPIIENLDITQVITYGLERPKITTLKSRLNAKGITFTSQKLSQAEGKHSYTRIDIQYPSHTTKLLFIRHPSAFFSWKKWGAYLQQELSLPKAF